MMFAPLRRLLVVLAVALAPAAAVSAQAAPGRLQVTYFEALPGRGAALAALLRGYAAARTASPAHPAVTVLQEQGRPERLAVVESWNDGAAADDTARAALEARAAPLLRAPADGRGHADLTPPLSDDRPLAAQAPFHMLMHLDVVPAGAETTTRLIVAERDAVLAAPGAVGFAAAVQDGKPNHFAIHQTWASRAAYDAWAASPPARELRARLAAFKGALFDDRYFVALPARQGAGK
jgi:quinol monooxygenase YgiN